MTLRQLAAKVGLQPASLYNHLRTKQDLLFDLIHDHMLTLLRSSSNAFGAANGEVIRQLRVFIVQHLTYHIGKKRKVFIAYFELRSFGPENYRKIIALRLDYERAIITILERCAADGSLNIKDSHLTAYAILAMLTGACTSYKPDGGLSKADVIELHTNLILFGCIGPQRRDAKVNWVQLSDPKQGTNVGRSYGLC